MHITVRRTLVALDESPLSYASRWHKVRTLYEDTHVDQF